MVNIKEYLQCNYPYLSSGDIFDFFVRFMVDNKWFGTKPQPANVNGNRTLLFTEEDLSLFESQLKFSMECKDLDNDKKATILLDRLSENYPLTGKTISAFLDGSSNTTQIALYGFLAKFLSKEVSEYTDKEMPDLLDFMCHEISLKAGQIFAQ